MIRIFPEDVQQPLQLGVTCVASVEVSTEVQDCRERKDESLESARSKGGKSPHVKLADQPPLRHGIDVGVISSLDLGVELDGILSVNVGAHSAGV